MVLVQFLMVLAQFLVVPPRSPSFDSVWLKLMNPFLPRPDRRAAGRQTTPRLRRGFPSHVLRGIVFFTLRTALDGGSWLTAVGYGAALPTLAGWLIFRSN
jgi:hypothetical protein